MPRSGSVGFERTQYTADARHEQPKDEAEQSGHHERPREAGIELPEEEPDANGAAVLDGKDDEQADGAGRRCRQSTVKVVALSNGYSGSGDHYAFTSCARATDR